VDWRVWPVVRSVANREHCEGEQTMNEEIVIDIDSDGGVVIEGKNFTGNECTALTKELENALGEVTRRTLKPEHRLSKSVLKKAGA
jgi:uncharacterized protein YuzE